MNADLSRFDWNRRDFLVGGSLATLSTLLVPPRALAAEQDKPVQKVVTAVKCGLIGIGSRGREILTELGRLSNADVVAVCDSYAGALKRGGDAAPKAKPMANYAELLADKSIEAVIIATPSHLHRDLCIAALEAGKHVYCEAPLAHSVEDARAIAEAAKKAAPKLYFQPGLQERSHPQRQFLLPFIRSGALGKPVKARAQWQKKTSWRAAAATPEREKALNWRLVRTTSPGLLGEIGVHQCDAISWFLGMRPTAVLGFSASVLWKDDRDVPDTVQAIFEFPGGVRLSQEITLGNSFDGDYEMLYGSDAAVMLRDNKAWMFKEADSPLLGWEVYARKDSFHKETGIALVANATKIAAQGAKPAEESPFPNPPVYYALEAFLFNAHEIGTAAADFVSNFGDDDKKALEAHLATLKLLPAATWKDGLEATVIALKANEAVLKGERIALQKEWFEV